MLQRYGLLPSQTNKKTCFLTSVLAHSAFFSTFFVITPLFWRPLRLFLFFLCPLAIFHVLPSYIQIEDLEKMVTDIETNLIEGLRERSPKAQQTMVERYGRHVFSQVVRLLPSVEDAEEVYQDVFLKVFLNINMYNEEKASFKTWVSRIAYNESITWLRHKRREVIYFEDQEGEAERLSETEVEATLGHPDPETVQLIRAALKHLPPEERSLITMFYYEEMSLKDIAYVTDSPSTTIASKLFRTRKKLCKIIQMIQS